jgi:glycosyltransferase involved in cell wall biosynthesis
MNILFVTEDHSIRNYGITSVVSQLADHLSSNYDDINITILSMGSEAVEQNARVRIVLVPHTKLGRFWGWSKNLTKNIQQTIEKDNIDIIHIHGIWMAAQWTALNAAKKYNLPCVVSPHGMLEKWMWNYQRQYQKIKKGFYFNLVFKPALSTETTFHAITPIELESLNRQLPSYHKVTIPNAVDSSFGQFNLEPHQPEKQFLFLGRIHPVKAVDILIDAFIKANIGSGWKLLIAGPEYVPNYVIELKNKVITSGMENRIIFTGPVYGEQKLKLLEQTWALVTPSHSEVMGMVNLEAAIQKVPSITTYETGLCDWEEGGGLLIHPNLDELTAALKIAAEWSIKERIDRGKRSFDLVAEKYSWQSVIPKWSNLYSSLLEKSKKISKE